MTELDDVNIRHIKLVTGDELIAIVLSEDDLNEEDYNPELLIVQKPMLVKIRMLEEGTSFLFYDWQPFSKDDTCFINPFHIISHVECSNDIKGQYINVIINSPSDEDPDDYDDNEEPTEPEQLFPSNRTLH